MYFSIHEYYGIISGPNNDWLWKTSTNKKRKSPIPVVSLLYNTSKLHFTSQTLDRGSADTLHLQFTSDMLRNTHVISNSQHQNGVTDQEES